MTADYLFIHAILITMRGNGVGILEDGAVAVTGNRISAVGATKEVLQDWSAHRVIDASGKVVMPGLIDAHIHTGDGLVRGVSNEVSKIRIVSGFMILASPSHSKIFDSNPLS